MFDHWCVSQKVESKEQIRQLILVEEHKNCLPAALSTYINEQKADILHKAATLADDFILTHKEKSWDKTRAVPLQHSENHSVVSLLFRLVIESVLL